LIERLAWHYQNRPADVPQPSNAYWMPLPSLVSVLPMWLFGPSFRAAQLAHTLLSVLLPALTFVYARALLGPGRPARLAALFTIFSGTYFIYWVNTDNFTPFALAGAGALVLLGLGEPRPRRWWLLALSGACVGLAHLARADGILLLVLAPLVVWLHARRLRRAGRSRTRAFCAGSGGRCFARAKSGCAIWVD
jgi:4-amino-4-deoxy-L-arabinose transferase-like glycosyltransferase